MDLSILTRAAFGSFRYPRMTSHDYFSGMIRRQMPACLIDDRDLDPGRRPHEPVTLEARIPARTRKPAWAPRCSIPSTVAHKSESERVAGPTASV